MPDDDQRDQTFARKAAKRNLVKDLWIGAGLLMLAIGETAAIAALALACTCLSFMILDETA